jgi:uncharacterized membrane protein YdjX (TVP38/TMEM64 family)
MTSSPQKERITLKKMLPILVIVAVAIAGFFLLGDKLNFQTLADNREALIAWRDSNYALAAIVYVAIYVAVVAFSLPGGSIMTLTGGFLFGLVAGATFTVTAATIGATAIFVAAKTGLGDALKARLDGSGGTLAKMRKGVEENAVSFLLLMRLVPAMPFWLANLAPAFLGVPLVTYVWTTFVGIIPGTVVYTWVGSGLGDVFARGETPDLGIIFTPSILGPILGLSALAALPLVIKAVKGRKALPLEE